MEAIDSIGPNRKALWLGPVDSIGWVHISIHGSHDKYHDQLQTITKITRSLMYILVRFTFPPRQCTSHPSIRLCLRVRRPCEVIIAAIREHWKQGCHIIFTKKWQTVLQIMTVGPKKWQILKIRHIQLFFDFDVIRMGIGMASAFGWWLAHSDGYPNRITGHVICGVTWKGNTH